MTDRKRLHLNWPTRDASRPPRELAALPAVEACDDAGMIVLTPFHADGMSLAIRLGPAEAIAIAGELIQAACARMGRLDGPPRRLAPESEPTA